MNECLSEMFMFSFGTDHILHINKFSSSSQRNELMKIKHPPDPDGTRFRTSTWKLIEHSTNNSAKGEPLH